MTRKLLVFAMHTPSRIVYVFPPSPDDRTKPDRKHPIRYGRYKPSARFRCALINGVEHSVVWIGRDYEPLNQEERDRLR